MSDSVVLAQIIRSGVVEGCHRGHAVVIDDQGDVVKAWGDPRVRILPRSANKIAQATAMVRAGLPLQGELLALAAASHSGEPFHVDGVRRILGDIAESDLQTPPDWPWDEEDRCALRATGAAPSNVYMNCSGKHAAMLRTCDIQGWDRADYLSLEHPLSRPLRGRLPTSPAKTPGLPPLMGVEHPCSVSRSPAWPGRALELRRRTPQTQSDA